MDGLTPNPDSGKMDEEKNNSDLSGEVGGTQPVPPQVEAQSENIVKEETDTPMDTEEVLPEVVTQSENVGVSENVANNSAGDDGKPTDSVSVSETNPEAVASMDTEEIQPEVVTQSENVGESENVANTSAGDGGNPSDSVSACDTQAENDTPMDTEEDQPVVVTPSENVEEPHFKVSETAECVPNNGSGDGGKPTDSMSVSATNPEAVAPMDTEEVQREVVTQPEKVEEVQTKVSENMTDNVNSDDGKPTDSVTVSEANPEVGASMDTEQVQPEIIKQSEKVEEAQPTVSENITNNASGDSGKPTDSVSVSAANPEIVAPIATEQVHPEIVTQSEKAEEAQPSVSGNITNNASGDDGKPTDSVSVNETNSEAVASMDTEEIHPEVVTQSENVDKVQPTVSENITNNASCADEKPTDSVSVSKTNPEIVATTATEQVQPEVVTQSEKVEEVQPTVSENTTNDASCDDEKPTDSVSVSKTNSEIVAPMDTEEVQPEVSTQSKNKEESQSIVSENAATVANSTSGDDSKPADCIGASNIVAPMDSDAGKPNVPIRSENLEESQAIVSESAATVANTASGDDSKPSDSIGVSNIVAPMDSDEGKPNVLTQSENLEESHSEVSENRESVMNDARGNNGKPTDSMSVSGTNPEVLALTEATANNSTGEKIVSDGPSQIKSDETCSDSVNKKVTDTNDLEQESDTKAIEEKATSSTDSSDGKVDAESAPEGSDSLVAENTTSESIPPSKPLVAAQKEVIKTDCKENVVSSSSIEAMDSKEENESLVNLNQKCTEAEVIKSDVSVALESNDVLLANTDQSDDTQGKQEGEIQISTSGSVETDESKMDVGDISEPCKETLISDKVSEPMITDDDTKIEDEKPTGTLGDGKGNNVSSTAMDGEAALDMQEKHVGNLEMNNTGNTHIQEISTEQITSGNSQTDSSVAAEEVKVETGNTEETPLQEVPQCTSDSAGETGNENVDDKAKSTSTTIAEVGKLGDDTSTNGDMTVNQKPAEGVKQTEQSDMESVTEIEKNSNSAQVEGDVDQSHSSEGTAAEVKETEKTQEAATGETEQKNEQMSSSVELNAAKQRLLDALQREHPFTGNQLVQEAQSASVQQKTGEDQSLDSNTTGMTSTEVANAVNEIINSETGVGVKGTTTSVISTSNAEIKEASVSEGKGAGEQTIATESSDGANLPKPVSQNQPSAEGKTEPSATAEKSGVSNGSTVNATGENKEPKGKTSMDVSSSENKPAGGATKAPATTKSSPVVSSTSSTSTTVSSSQLVGQPISVRAPSSAPISTQSSTNHQGWGNYGSGYNDPSAMAQWQSGNQGYWGGMPPPGGAPYGPYSVPPPGVMNSSLQYAQQYNQWQQSYQYDQQGGYYNYGQYGQYPQGYGNVSMYNQGYPQTQASGYYSWPQSQGYQYYNTTQSYQYATTGTTTTTATATPPVPKVPVTPPAQRNVITVPLEIKKPKEPVKTVESIPLPPDAKPTAKVYKTPVSVGVKQNVVAKPEQKSEPKPIISAMTKKEIAAQLLQKARAKQPQPQPPPPPQPQLPPPPQPQPRPPPPPEVEVPAKKRKIEEPGIVAGPLMTSKHLCIGNLPQGTKATALRDMLAPFGKVLSCKVASGKGPNAGIFAFVTIECLTDASTLASSLNGWDFNGCKLTAKKLKNPPGVKSS